MNRRGFLSFLSVAPVAVPMAAQAIAEQQGILPARFFSLNATDFVGVDGASMTSDFVTPSMMASQNYTTGDVIEEANRRLALYRNYVPSIEAQMRADDLFDFEPLLRDTAEPQAPVSPDKENRFPTADQDDTRQSAHVSDTLIPNSACRLSRSWGAV
jgi:hypothetical protein